jgi:hypothetical protein
MARLALALSGTSAALLNALLWLSLGGYFKQAESLVLGLATLSTLLSSTLLARAYYVRGRLPMVLLCVLNIVMFGCCAVLFSGGAPRIARVFQTGVLVYWLNFYLAVLARDSRHLWQKHPGAGRV